tara:strand:- start:16 stop:228 length:213 start_codon:yes stop_codon:yes gene_type:complete
MNNEIQITWTIQDIQDRYKKLYPNNTLSNKNAREVLFLIKNNHDAEVGINFEVIDVAIECFKKWQSADHE